MTDTKIQDVQDQVQKYWSPRFTKELRETMFLPSLVSKDYEGEIKKGGDTVRVSQIVSPTGQNLDIGVNADSFDSEKLTTLKVDVKADKRAVASFEFEDLVDIQSLISKDNPEVMDALRFAIEKQINTYLYSLVSPSTSSPDHVLNSVSAFSATELALLRKNAGNAKWPKDGRWYLLLNSDYYVDCLGVTSLTSSDYVGDQPVVGGEIAVKRYGFQIYEDNSLSSKYGLAFHPSFMHMVSQPQVQIKISDLHSQHKFGYLMSVDLIYGAILATDGNVRHQTVVPT